MATLPEWAGMPALILITALGLYVMVWVIRWQRSRADGAYFLAQAALPLDQQQHAGYAKRYASPDRRFVAVTGAHEVRMSIWLEELSLCDVQRNRWILNLPHPYSVSGVTWGADNRLRFSVNRYPDGGPWIDVVLDPEARMAEVGGTVTPATVPFARLVAWLNAFYKRAFGRFFASDGPGTLALPGAPFEPNIHAQHRAAGRGRCRDVLRKRPPRRRSAERKNSHADVDGSCSNGYDVYRASTSN